MLEAVAVESFENLPDGVVIKTSTGQLINARALVVATGSTYRRTEAEGEEDLIGAGIHFCATCDGPFYKGASEVTVIGAGNSGLEEGLFLTQFADHVTVIAKGKELKGSRLLQEKVLAHPKMSVIFEAKVKKFVANSEGKLSSIILTKGESDQESEFSTSGVFVFIGLDPNTAWLPPQIERDARGFALTDSAFMTSAPRIFAAGDVRAGSTKQLASAVGEGAAVAIQIRRYLDAN
jgi:thioredoxin reductase (NADPH)